MAADPVGATLQLVLSHSDPGKACIYVVPDDRQARVASPESTAFLMVQHLSAATIETQTAMGILALDTSP
jgi:hypothetical protein